MQAFFSALKGDKFKEGECCLQDADLKKAEGIRTDIECMVTCMNTYNKCKGVAYDSVLKICYMSASSGSTCAPSGKTYCGKLWLHV